jgi:hypothetical protein
MHATGNTLDDAVGGMIIVVTRPGSPGTSHRPRPVQGSASRGAQRSVESFLSLSQQDGHRGRQGHGAIDEECERGCETIRLVRVLPPPAPNDLRGRQASREEFLYWLRLGSFDDGGAKGTLQPGCVWADAVEPTLHRAPGADVLQCWDALVVDVKAHTREHPRGDLQQQEERDHPRGADLVRRAIELRGGGAMQQPASTRDDGLFEAVVAYQSELARAPVMAMPARTLSAHPK